MSLASDRAFPRHSHDQYGIGLIAAGGQRSWSGIGQVDAVAGDIITVNPGEVHDGAPLRGTRRAWHMLYFDPVLVRQYIDGPDAPIEMARPALNDPLLLGLMRQLFHRLAAAPGNNLDLEERCCQLLGAAFSRHGSRRLDLTPCFPGNIARVRQRLDDAPQQAVTLGELADMAGLSRYQLLRSFSRALGITPHAYLLQRRVLMVRHLIASGHSLSHAALEAGFSDQSHMSRAFSRQFGLSPGRYRRALCPPEACNFLQDSADR
ncbi:AraC family transcriptional regulator [Halomonas sp. DX6]|uniref:AraC family transcriptional regulator n=2 Tax=Billgrantia bachuensis TaxID=2717286 RepID=A0ABX0PPS4_9GAMM|nr:AraC family transcriptional regulator [Halomonas bachuensis]